MCASAQGNPREIAYARKDRPECASGVPGAARAYRSTASCTQNRTRRPHFDPPTPMPVRSQAIRCVLILAWAGSLALSAHAADAIGVVKTVKGSVHIQRAGQALDATVGSEVHGSDRVVTGPASAVGITLRDDTLLSEGANSVLDLNKFAFNTTTWDGTLDVSIKRGSLAVVDGKLAKANPEAVRYSTPTTTLGVRGTEFIIEVGGGENDH